MWFGVRVVAQVPKEWHSWNREIGKLFLWHEAKFGLEAPQSEREMHSVFPQMWGIATDRKSPFGDCFNMATYFPELEKVPFYYYSRPGSLSVAVQKLAFPGSAIMSRNAP